MPRSIRQRLPPDDGAEDERAHTLMMRAMWHVVEIEAAARLLRREMPTRWPRRRLWCRPHGRGCRPSCNTLQRCSPNIRNRSTNTAAPQPRRSIRRPRPVGLRCRGRGRKHASWLAPRGTLCAMGAVRTSCTAAVCLLILGCLYQLFQALLSRESTDHLIIDDQRRRAINR